MSSLTPREIVSELDHVTAVEIMDVIADAQKKFELTSIMVHHDMSLALEYANRVAVIKNGEFLSRESLDSLIYKN